MSKRKFDIRELSKAMELIELLNCHGLRELEFVHNGLPLMQPTEKQISEWEYTGLNNKDFVHHFITTGTWPTWIKSR